MKSFTHKAGYYAFIGSILGAIGLFGTFSFAQSTGIDLYFDLPTSLQGGTFPVWFRGGGNNYAGSLIFNNQTSVTQVINFVAGGSVTCKRQIHGYYFNAARGVGLLPLSDETESNDGVTVVGGLYTSCGNGARLYDLVGMLEYQKNGVDIGKVAFGVQTNLTNNSSNGTYQQGAISWKVSNGVNGRFFDTMFGIGDISSSGTGLGVIGSLSNLIGTFTNIYIQGHVGIGQSVESSEREILTVNLAGTKTLLTSSDELLSADIINTVAKNTAKKCRSTTTYTTANVGAGDIGTNKFICIDLAGDTHFTIDSSNILLFYKKDIVFLNGNVFLSEEVYKQTNYSNYLSFYIPNGNLIFDTDITPSTLTNIDNNGFAQNGSNIGVTSGVYLVGNFIVNGLVVGLPVGSTYGTIPFKTIIHGKLVSLNTFTTVSEKREKQLGQTLGTTAIPSTRPRSPLFTELQLTPNSYYPNGVWSAGMGDVFAWKCADISTGSQVKGFGKTPIGVFQPATVNAVHSIACPPGHRYPLMIIERSLPTSFFLK